MEKPRPIFIYLAILAIVLGIIGIILIENSLSGRTISGKGINEIYNLNEISEHNSEKDCWVSSEGKVYDITLFLQIYEDKTLSDGCGGGVDLAAVPINARKILQAYQIGILG